ncbi:hypothetical protein EIP91_010394 [Steccherinum ochraceum]|uniref:NAD(P)-binding protein n=1 Tax=Steccherinum ochraceum TaxID=92696 RepID=A0A4R0RNG5_9APHY|nr:hypothetical protein EIP91_010394 [Steccherinum ochraceum]
MGHFFSLLSQQLFPHKTTFTAEQIPDLTGRVVIVTGGNSGLGKEVIKALLNRNAKVYMAARSKGKAEEAIKELKEATGKDAHFLALDLSSLASVRRAAEEFRIEETELHILYNNAGLMNTPMDDLTSTGFDLQYGTNVLGHFLFTELLLPALAAGAQSSPDHHSRIVATSSAGAHMATVDFDSLKDGPARRKLSPELLYWQSKFLNAIVAREAAKRYADKSILSFSVDPGSVRTDIMRHEGAFMKKMSDTLFVSPAKGALSQPWIGTVPEAVQYNGEYIVPWAHVGKCRAELYDNALAERVWNTVLEDQ